MDWLRKILLRGYKKKALVEVRADINFIKTFRKDWLEYDEKEGRSILRKQDAKGDKKDEDLVNKTSKKIAQHLATVKELGELQIMESDLIRYIDLI